MITSFDFLQQIVDCHWGVNYLQINSNGVGFFSWNTIQITSLVISGNSGTPTFSGTDKNTADYQFAGPPASFGYQSVLLYLPAGTTKTKINFPVLANDTQAPGLIYAQVFLNKPKGQKLHLQQGADQTPVWIVGPQPNGYPVDTFGSLNPSNLGFTFTITSTIKGKNATVTIAPSS